MTEREQYINCWQNEHRGKIHDKSSWSTSTNDPSLTYVPTSAGFTGIAQMERFLALFPQANHPLSHEQLKRYNNDYQIVSCNFDPTSKTITEEIVISSLHNTRLDYLMPAVEATNLVFAISITIIAKYAKDQLLDSVRLYWDQATLLRQLGIFHIAFHNLIQATGKLAAFENELDQVPIADGMKTARRLVNPTMQNCNFLLSLEALEAHSNKSLPISLKLSPIGGVDNITLMTNELSIFDNKSNQAAHVAKSFPAMKSSIFDCNNDNLPQSQSQHHARRYLTNSTEFRLVLGDGSADPLPPAAMHHASKMSIFGEQQHEDATIPRPNISIDPLRNQSSVFTDKDPSSKSFDASLPLTDRSRFESRIFSNNSPIATPMHHSIKINAQLQSHIFDKDPVIDTSKRHTIAQQSRAPFGNDDDQKTTFPTNTTGMKRHNAQLDGHFSGSGFDFSGPEPAASSQHRHFVDPNKSSFRLTDETVDAPRASIANSRAASHNVSQIQFGDNPPLLPLQSSTRVLQPPGGRSTIFLS